MSRIVLREVTTLDPSLTSIAAVALGEGAIHSHLLVEKDGIESQHFELRRSHRAECWFRTDAIFWNDQIVIGFAERVYFVHRSGTVTRCIELQEYFSEFRLGDDWLLVVTGRDITRLDDHGNIVWRSECLGLDGVAIHAICDDVISGEGQWDPPGDWQPFVVILSNGVRARSPERR